jgi:hypothetical protein
MATEEVLRSEAGCRRVGGWSEGVRGAAAAASSSSEGGCDAGAAVWEIGFGGWVKAAAAVPVDS